MHLFHCPNMALHYKIDAFWFCSMILNHHDLKMQCFSSEQPVDKIKAI